ncbi:MAG: glycosyltransferase family 39 protein [Anaerolineae bacterium]|nr:glycosyltransferase family 39 protein [Anaerolineae bacterium]
MMSHAPHATARPDARYPVILLALAAILAFALFARLWDLTRESFWADEGWTMLLAKGPTLADVVRTLADDQHPPLYFALLRPWMDLTGDSEFSARLFSTFWSVFGVAVVYRIAADAFSPGAGLIAALVLALTDNDIMLAREARHYAQMAALGALSSLFYLRHLKRPRRRNGLGWLLSSIALMYTHYLGALLLAVQGLHLLLFARPARRLADMLFRLALIGVAWLPWAVVFLEQSLIRYTRPILFQSTLPNTPETFTLVRGDLVGSQYGLSIGLMILGLAYVTYRLGAPQVTLRPARPTVYLGLWALLPIVAIVVLNTRFPILTTRNFLIVTPAIALLIGHGLMNLDRTARTFLLAVFVVVSLFSVDAYHKKPPYRELTADLVADWQPTSQPALMDIWVDDFALRYHIGRALGVDPATLPLISLHEWRERYGADFYAYLLERLRDTQTLWLAYWGPAENPLFQFLGDHGFVRTATHVRQHQGNDIFLYRYDRPPDGEIARFGDLFALKQAAILPERPAPGESLRVQTLWQSLAATPLDYSLSAVVLGPDGALVAQNDGPPMNGNAPTSGWRVGDFVFDGRTITLRPALAPGRYTVGLKVYFYADPEPLPITRDSEAVGGLIEVGSFEITPS